MHRDFEILSMERIGDILSRRHNHKFLTLKDLPDPYTFKDMQKAAHRVAGAIKNGEKITLIGDYDVDGVSATSVMRLFFDDLGYRLNWKIPNRFRHGYGLSPLLMPEVIESDLIITVDNGISAVEAADICKANGIDLIITDHHIVPDIKPEAYAIVNQKQSDCLFPYPEVCGAQIAWYLCAAIKREMSLNIDMRRYIPIVSLAIIADIMPLNGINRSMVISGLKLLAISDMPFIRAYRQKKNIESFRAEDIAFGLAPVLNSAGRLEDASLACDYICSKNIYEAVSMLERLSEINERRKSLEADITKEAVESADSDAPVMIIAGEEWHEGVIGIVAARVARHFEKPTLILTQNGDEYKGSGRSFGDCNLFELVDSGREFTSKFGGHRAAVGLSLPKENLEAFKERLYSVAMDICSQEVYEDPDILGILDLSLIDYDLYALIDSFEPYGEANPKPKFISKNVKIVGYRELGEAGNHISLQLAQNGSVIKAVKFRVDDDEKEHIKDAEFIDILYTISENIFNGNRSLQLMVEKVIVL